MPLRRLCGAQKEGERGSSRVESPQSGGEAASDGHVAPTHLGEHVTEVITSKTRDPLLYQNKCYKVVRYILG